MRKLTIAATVPATGPVDAITRLKQGYTFFDSAAPWKMGYKNGRFFVTGDRQKPGTQILTQQEAMEWIQMAFDNIANEFLKLEKPGKQSATGDKISGKITKIQQEPYNLGHITFVYVKDSEGITHKLDKSMQPSDIKVGENVTLQYQGFMWRII